MSLGFTSNPKFYNEDLSEYQFFHVVTAIKQKLLKPMPELFDPYDEQD